MGILRPMFMPHQSGPSALNNSIITGKIQTTQIYLFLHIPTAYVKEELRQLHQQATTMCRQVEV